MDAASESAQRASLLKKAVADYHQLLNDPNLAAASCETLHNGLEKNRLIFGGRPLSPYLRPHFITASDWERVKATCETVWSALQKVKDAAVQVRRDLGRTRHNRDRKRSCQDRSGI